MNVSKFRFLLLFLLLPGLLSCRSNSTQHSDALIREAIQISARQTKLTEEWAREYIQAFTQENRSKFPSNRVWLIDRVKKISALIDESSRLGNDVAEKYEEAIRLMSNDLQKRGFTLIASSARKDVEIAQLFKAAAQLVSDPTINDAKALNEKIEYFKGLINQKQKEKDDEFDQGKRLLLGR